MTRRDFTQALFVLFSALFGFSATARAETSPRLASIMVKDMHCNACAKKIAARLSRVEGVLEIRADVQRHTAFVGLDQQKQPSPRAMWEAVEAAGFQPVQLNGPFGRFTSKPTR